MGFVLALGVFHFSDVIWSQSGSGLRVKQAHGKNRKINKQSKRSSKPQTSLVHRIRYVSSNSYTRVIMDLSWRIKYETHVLKGNPAKGLPPRIYVDLSGAHLASDLKRKIVVQDRLLQQVRVGQFKSDVVRMVLDMKSLRDYRVFLLPSPFRLVMDVHGKGNGTRPRVAKKPNRNRLAKQKNGWNGKTRPGRIRKIVLDPGHGGKDPGAVGVNGLAEKDIVLALAKRLAKKLKRKMRVEVVLTRERDVFVPLEERTAFANAQNADLFVSLHINASRNRRLRGIESYYLDNATDEATIRLAARENGTSRRNISDLQFILSDLTQNSKLEDSIGLAHHIQSTLVSHMGRKYRRVKNLGVKKGLFYVLVGARMPSVLLELFFITNRYEGRALARERFQDDIVDALYLGVKKYDASTVGRNL